jgi:RNase P subunit RPR2
MDQLSKICPHCKTQLQPGEGAFELVKKGAGGSEPSSGLPVTFYSCPRCGYIELYNLKVISRI